jgi:hypothetical protein
MVMYGNGAQTGTVKAMKTHLEMDPSIRYPMRREEYYVEDLGTEVLKTAVALPGSILVQVDVIIL